MTADQTTWVDVDVTNLAEAAAREFSAGEGDWPLRGFVVRHQGQWRAYVNRCPHARLTLNFRPDEFFAADAPLLQCTVHGALFEPLTGHCVQGPCAGQSLISLPVQIHGDTLQVGVTAAVMALA